MEQATGLALLPIHPSFDHARNHYSENTSPVSNAGIAGATGIQPAMPVESSLPRTMCEIKHVHRSMSVEALAAKNREIDGEFLMQ